LVLLAVGLALAPGRGNADPKTEKSPAELVAPKEGAIVAEVEEYEGRLTNGAWPVVFVRRVAEDELWWVQPPVDEVADGQFTGRAHFGANDVPKGTKFAVVILVAKNKEDARKFKPGTTLKELPADLPRSREVTVFRDARGPDKGSEPRALKFSGRAWQVKAGRRLGPGPNDFSDAPENVWLDDKDRLHLAITKVEDRWQCAEVVADKSLGYGDYRWVVSGDLSALDRQAVLGLFTYETTTREIDFELARWGDPTKENAQFVVQPYTAKDSTYRFDTGKANVLTCSLLWETSVVRGRCWEGEDTTKEPLADWQYKGRHIPRPGKERARANLWLFGGRPPTSGARQEVVIHSFQVTPAVPPKGK
jgi:hypothetical protein